MCRLTSFAHTASVCVCCSLDDPHLPFYARASSLTSRLVHQSHVSPRLLSSRPACHADVQVHEVAAAKHPQLHGVLDPGDSETEAYTELSHELLYSVLAHGAGLSNEVAPLLALHLEPSAPMRVFGEAHDREVLRRALST